jgi:hypothetical protein
MSPTPELVGHDATRDRDLYVLEVDSPSEVPATLPLSSSHFVCLVAANAHALSDGEVHRLASQLLRSGAVTLCTWGPGCGRVHDLFEDAVLFHEPSQLDETHVTTTPHEEHLEDALCFFLERTWPADAYVDSCRSSLALVLGMPREAARIREALERPTEFVRVVHAREGGTP